MSAKFYHSVEELLSQQWHDQHGCIVIDVRLPGTNGLEFQEERDRFGISLPMIFMTGYGNIPMSVRAMKAGAVDFLAKPFGDQELLDAIALALRRDQSRREVEQEASELHRRLQALTGRELQIFGLVASGRLNKQIAGDLNLSEITVKIHRASVMRKMGARSFAELVRTAKALGV